MGLSILTLGHGGGVPVNNAGNTNFALIPGREVSGTIEAILGSNPYWLIDCGPETATQLMISGVIHNLQGIILTHCHNDHSGGLPSLAWRLNFIEQKKIGLIYHKSLEPFLDAQLIELKYRTHGKVDWHSYWHTNPVSDSEIVSLKDFSVYLFPVDHNIPDFPSYGVEVETDHSVVVFSGDTAKPLRLEENVDLMYYDVQFYSEDRSTAVHCPYVDLEAMIPEHSRQRVMLAHTTQTPPETAFGWAEKGSIRWVA